MPIDILMPALSPTMTEGTLARWLKQPGETVAPGDVIAEIETDKATMEVEAVDEGVLSRILVAEGTAGVAVNTPIAVLDGVGGGAAPAPAPAVAAPAPSPARPVEAPAPAAAPAAAKAPAAQANGAMNGAAPRVAASPLARRMAAQAGIELASLTGSGPHGRIVRADVEAKLGRAAAPAETPAARAAAAPPSPAPAPAAPVATGLAPHRLVPHTAVRRVTAKRLLEAKQTIPHFYVSVDVALDALMEMRHALNAKSPAGEGAFKLSVNDMLIKACAVTLRRIPEVNASFTEAGVALFEDVDVSVAVSIPGGLITPVIRQADRKGLATISTEARGLFERARAGKLKPEEYQGGGFSLSNMGMLGVSSFSAIINPPQAAILAIAAAERRPVVRGNEIVIATMMTATLSVDHRAIDGALAAAWLGAFRSVVEDPLGLML
jgi:pyruvate dehydrogenase E2 component (dihydrolipoamide acetyltransferase)